MLCGVITLFYACKKHDDKPCCETEPPEARWVLNSVLSRYQYGPGVYDDWLHTFSYNTFNKPVRHTETRPDIFDPAPQPILREDSFFYNNKQQLIMIRSIDTRGLDSYKEIFTYGRNDRRLYSLKYLADNTNQYLLVDSTVYQYPGSTIRKITYHLSKPGTDTAIFVYDQRQNLSSVKIPGYRVQALQLYDSVRSPATYFNITAFELDPYSSGGWDIEFLIMMQAPRFSRNNYWQRQDIMPIEYTVSYSAVDSTVVTISSPRENYTEEAVHLYSYGLAR
jgi:hypothetical protein